MQQLVQRPAAGNPNQNARPTRVLLAARVAAEPVGYASKINLRGTALHFTILLENFREYSVYGFDGQPD
jgi:hypothetical protein